MPKIPVPKYRRHRASGQAVVTIDGKDCYLGAWGTAESRAAYARLMVDRFAAHRPPPPQRPGSGGGIAVVELIARYWQFAEGYYVRRDGKVSGELC